MTTLIALIPALAWGSIGLISGKMGGSPSQQTLGMTIGAVIFGVLSLVIFQPTLTTKVWVIGFLSGIFWFFGQLGQFQSMKAIGISKTVPMSTGLQLAGNALAGVVIFHEWKTGAMITSGTIAVIILIIGATLTALRDTKTNAITKKSENIGAGAFALAFSTVGYVLYTVIVTWGSVDSKAIVFPQSIGMLLGALVYSLNKDPWNKGTYKNILTGVVWGVGNFFMFLSIPAVGLAISYSISQMGIVISTFGSIFLLGEKKTSREMVYVTIGSILVIVGGVILSSMR
ncbi:GRP family sugar transporter [Secundilactobacillus malefermentans]|uniref:Sugar transport protein n=1 Tax=Secundilactobacillus malefermentans TaxID=176292 RepID=A0A4R5NQG0_9LACO|nr:GRP family sugar transporter [Secundilactobacillus malefermentans]KRM57699.1 glucose uptake permease [Secundilactobacillus malefermentans DSM 5705 = KCTC 3548]QEA32133.1 glucose transporter GlcU [Secundilactobacillus malefermentans]TDG78863.1 hypothetical protein C5L31_000523 [Secundilactobacillus malefermentans]